MFKQSTIFCPNFQPGPHDVICAKSPKAHQHVGNRRFRLLLEFHMQTYEAAVARRTKRDVLESVFAAVHAGGGRFIRPSKDEESWESLDSVQIREKIGHGLRHAIAASCRAKPSSSRLDVILNGQQKKKSSKPLSRVTSKEGPVDSLSYADPALDPTKWNEEKKSPKSNQCMDPLPMACTSDFENNPRASLVKMLLSTSSKEDPRRSSWSLGEGDGLESMSEEEDSMFETLVENAIDL